MAAVIPPTSSTTNQNGISSAENTVTLGSSTTMSPENDGNKRNSATMQAPARTMCQRHQWSVQTKDLDLDLYRPRTIDLGFCAGSCPFPFLSSQYNVTLHSIILGHYR